MSTRGIDFLRKWVFDNVNAVTFPDENDTEVDRYAIDAREAAAKAGISVREIEEDMGPISDYIHEQMNEMAHNELDRRSAKDP
jgi:hypothetical protein